MTQRWEGSRFFIDAQPRTVILLFALINSILATHLVMLIARQRFIAHAIIFGILLVFMALLSYGSINQQLPADSRFPFWFAALVACLHVLGAMLVGWRSARKQHRHISKKSVEHPSAKN